MWIFHRIISCSSLSVWILFLEYSTGKIEAKLKWKTAHYRRMKYSNANNWAKHSEHVYRVRRTLIWNVIHLRCLKLQTPFFHYFFLQLNAFLCYKITIDYNRTKCCFHCIALHCIQSDAISFGHNEAINWKLFILFKLVFPECLCMFEEKINARGHARSHTFCHIYTDRKTTHIYNILKFALRMMNGF